MTLAALLLVGACTVGEAPRQGPPAPPAGEEAPAVPGVDGGGRTDASPEAEDRAAELLGRAGQAYEAARVDEARELAGQVLTGYAGTAAVDSARWLAARAAFATGRYGEARELAAEHVRAHGESGPRAEEARQLVELAEDAASDPSPAVVGAVLPRTGQRVLVRYADWLLEGIQLAVAEAERQQGRPIDLVVVDDAGGDRAREAVAELERRGAVAVVGPLLPRTLAVAAGARSNERLVLVSPTATETPEWRETYSINSGDARGARELGRYASDLGFRQAAILYARNREYGAKARAFTAEFESLGGRVRASVPYDSGTTTFEMHMETILGAAGQGQPGAAGPIGEIPADTGVAGAAGQGGQAPFALFVAAPPQDVRQIAPQVSFYGLDSAGVQIFGDEAWSTAVVRRVVSARDLEGVLAASHFPPDRAGGAADPSFVEAYEATYRKSLDNAFPALGYDAANLVLQALPNRALRPDALARRFELLAGIRGATGLLSVRGGRVIRTPYLVEIRGGELVPAPFPWAYEMPQPKLPVPEDDPPGGRRR